MRYSADADFSCFADLALTSPVDYYKDGEGSLMQVVITPADSYMPMANDAIASEMDKQVKSEHVIAALVLNSPGRVFLFMVSINF